MSSFTVYADWQPSSGDADALLGIFEDVLGATDADRCVWVDERKPSVVQMSFDIEAADYELAIEQARLLLSEEASVRDLPGLITEITAMTEEGQLRWTVP